MQEVHAEACRLMAAARGSETDGLCSTCFLAYGEVLAKRGKWSEAEPFYAKALPVQQAVEGPTHPDSRRAAKQYALVLEALGRPEQVRRRVEGRARGGRQIEGGRSLLPTSVPPVCPSAPHDEGRDRDGDGRRQAR